jgi:hypothetical protein
MYDQWRYFGGWGVGTAAPGINLGSKMNILNKNMIFFAQQF